MPDIPSLIASGAANPWLFVPFAVLLGALHGLEPGHAKSMMAAFVVAVRGTKMQAALLGLSAAVSHSVVVATLAFLGLWLGDAAIGTTAQPWLHLLGGGVVVAMALWMLLQTARLTTHHHAHGHSHNHDHSPACCGHNHDGAHAARRLMAQGQVTTWQIMMFGATGGLMPCPASLAVLLVCLQLREFTLGAGMVAAFSAGLALTLMAVGVLAAWGRGRVEKLYGGTRAATWVRYLPLGSAVLMLLLGGLMAASGLVHLL